VGIVNHWENKSFHHYMINAALQPANSVHNNRKIYSFVRMSLNKDKFINSMLQGWQIWMVAFGSVGYL